MLKIKAIPQMTDRRPAFLRRPGCEAWKPRGRSRITVPDLESLPLMRTFSLLTASCVLFSAAPMAVHAESPIPDAATSATATGIPASHDPSLFAGSRLIATNGTHTLDGSSGGALVPWAVIAGLETRDQIGASAYYTRADPTDFSLYSTGAALGFYNRLELSYARLRFGTASATPGQAIGLDVVGLKLRLYGDLLYNPQPWQPQLAFGVQYKHNRNYDGLPRATGARHRDGTDFYLAATRIWLNAFAGRNVLFNATLRATTANQLGLLGFGGDRGDHYSLQPELSAGVFLNDHWLLGAEYRSKPDNLRAAREDAYESALLTWFPLKRASLSAGWSWLGTLHQREHQQALTLSAQLSF